MKIVVNKFTYSSGNFQVNVGDTVLLPYPHWHPDAGRGDGILGIVSQVGSDYKGYLRPILGVVERASNVGKGKPSAEKLVDIDPNKPKKCNKLVTVKQIEQFIREAMFLVIDDRSFRYTDDGWREMT